MLALLLQGLTSSEAWDMAIRRSDQGRRVQVALVGAADYRAGGLTVRQGESAAGHPRVVPIRFPATVHEQLKAWCEQHKFPMAAVVRGLVERFLESQELP